MVKSVILKDMNIFFLSFDPSDCAELYCDQHVVKILLEIVQMLYTAWHFLGPPDWNQTAPLKNNSQQKGYLPVSNPKHGMVMWVRSSEENYKWVWHLVRSSQEGSRRFILVTSTLSGYLKTSHKTLWKSVMKKLIIRQRVSRRILRPYPNV